LTALVLSGVSDEETVNQYPFKPTFVAQDLTKLITTIS